MVLRRIGVGSAAKISGLLYALLGLIAGAIFALVSLVGTGFMAAAGNGNDVPPWAGAMFGVGAVIFLPILYGIMGVVVGAVTAAVYNLVAAVAGGLEMDIQ